MIVVVCVSSRLKREPLRYSFNWALWSFFSWATWIVWRPHLFLLVLCCFSERQREKEFCSIFPAGLFLHLNLLFLSNGSGEKTSITFSSLLHNCSQQSLCLFRLIGEIVVDRFLRALGPILFVSGRERVLSSQSVGTLVCVPKTITRRGRSHMMCVCSVIPSRLCYQKAHVCSYVYYLAHIL